MGPNSFVALSVFEAAFAARPTESFGMVQKRVTPWGQGLQPAGSVVKRQVANRLRTCPTVFHKPYEIPESFGFGACYALYISD